MKVKIILKKFLLAVLCCLMPGIAIVAVHDVTEHYLLNNFNLSLRDKGLIALYCVVAYFIGNVVMAIYIYALESFKGEKINKKLQ